MSQANQALLVIDVQESFRHRDYWSEKGLGDYVQAQQSLINQAQESKTPIVQIFHLETANAPIPGQSL